MNRLSLSILLAAAGLASPLKGETRHTEPVTLHGYHPFREVAEAKDWPDRKEAIKTRSLLACGLLPLPEKTPLNAHRFGAVEQDGFKVERIYFESFPGHYVTGSLFTPTGESARLGLIEGKRPAVLCPHGHWKNGRLFDLAENNGEKAVKQQIAIGAERFEAAARNGIVARCVQLARMGCIAFAYDMIGEADSVQFAEHRRGPRPHMNGARPGTFGFVSPQATLRLQTNFGLQTWNSIRAVDFIESLEETDSDRLLVTGASGGGTQTMLLAAVDDRIDASFPCVMPSTAMQGGCTCENTHYLRIGQGNMDLAAAIAPKPLGMTAADDWTIELETKGYPDLKNLYQMLKAPNDYEAHFNIHFKHNYNHVSRTQMYDFVNRHFKLGLETPVLERNFTYLTRDDIGVWSDSVPKPDGYLSGDAHEKNLNRVWAEDAEAKFEIAKKDPAKRDWVRTGWETILRASDVKDTTATFELGEKSRNGDSVLMDGTITGNSSPFSAAIAYPATWNGEVLIQLHPSGASVAIENKLDAAVIIPDLYGQNDELAKNAPITYSGKSDPPADSWQRSPVYFYGYNDSVFVRRVHDLISTIAMAKQHPDWDVKKIKVHATGDLAAVALAANAIYPDAIDTLEVDPEDFQFTQIKDLWDDNMVPGAVRYGDVEGLKLIQ
ncbi:MAG: acetylxylan esterase [Verrucomicrobiales bacterium]|nr:acetylxylan esterase [Verrucomicrobiales bacterium]